MQPLLDGLIARVCSDAVLAQTVGSAPAVYLDQAPETTAMPFMTLHIAATAPGPAGAHDFAGDRMTHSTLTLTAVADALSTALAMADRLTALLDAAVFPLSAGVLLDCRQMAAPQPLLAGFDAANDEVYRVEVKFVCTVFESAGR